MSVKFLLRKFFDLFRISFRYGLEQFLISNMKFAIDVGEKVLNEGPAISTKFVERRLWTELHETLPWVPGTWITILSALVIENLKSLGKLNFETPPEGDLRQ